MSLRRAAEILSEEPAKLANLHASKGFIREGYDADLMVLGNFFSCFIMLMHSAYLTTWVNS